MRLRGRDLVVFRGDNGNIQDSSALGLATSCAVTIDRDIMEVTNPLSGKSKSFLSGRYGWTVTSDGLVTTDGSILEDLLVEMDRKVVLFIGSARRQDGELVPAGDGFSLKGEAYISSIRLTGTENGSATYSVTFRGTGDINYIPY